MERWDDNNGFPMKVVAIGAGSIFLIGCLVCVALWKILHYLFG